MSRQARALWIAGAERAELRDEMLPACGPGEVLVEARFSAISRGTEALIFGHAVPESEWQRMRAPHQAGQLPGPVKYGYANVGRVVEGPEALRGRSVFCLYPHQTAYVVSSEDVHVLPDAVPEPRAVLAANMETALNAMWDATPVMGQRIVVIGAGVVGALCAYLAQRVAGCEVCLVDRRPERGVVAAALGVSFAEPLHAPREADLVVHASGSAAGLALALEVAAQEGVVLELSWFGDRAVTVPLGAAFHARRLTLRSSQVGMVGAAMRGRRSHAQRLALALALLADPALDVLISDECAFAELPARLPAVLGRDSPVLCQRVRYA